MKNKKTAFKLTILLLCIMLIMPFFNIAHSKTNKVIRVGYPLMQGLSMKDDDGNYYGYDYDYLMQIAQYAGWTYEFVEVDGTLDERLGKLMDMLANGEIDLIGGVKYMDALTDKYEYASESYGNAYNIIAVNDASELYDLNTLIAKKDLHIGVLANSSARIENLKQFSISNGFTYEKTEYDSMSALVEAMDKKEVDAILSVDLSKPTTYTAVARFAPDPFYFITTKGNSEITSELNQALDNIHQINPTLSSTLYTRYFSGEHNSLQLTNTEKEYVDEHPTINVLAYDGNAPIQYNTKQGVAGVGKDILDSISKQSGLSFQYFIVDNFEDFKTQLESGKFELVLGIPYEGSRANDLNLTLSDSYINTSLQLITSKGIDANNLEDKRVGLSKYQNHPFDNNKNFVFFESMEEVLQGVNNGEADYAYINSYLYTFYMNKNHYTNISAYSTADYLRIQYAFGVPNTETFALLSILNKGIRISRSELQSFIYNHGNVDQEYTLTMFIENNLLFVSIFALTSIIMIFSSIWLYYQRQLKMKKEVELEYQRYLELSEISGEITFSYDYRHDEFKLSTYGIGRLAKKATISPFLAYDQEEPLPCSLQIIQNFLHQREDVNEEMYLQLLDGYSKWYQITIKVIREALRNDAIAVYVVGKVQDIHADVEERQKLVEKSQTDALTGLLNREGAQVFIMNAIAKENEVGALLMMDLDNFKDVNDTYGHLEGDHVLIETSILLKQVFRNAAIARLGGDEFIIYCGSIDQAQIQALCDELLTSITSLPCMRRREVPLTVSVGIAFTSITKNYMDLMRYADESLYYVKRNNRNGYHISERK